MANRRSKSYERPERSKDNKIQRKHTTRRSIRRTMVYQPKIPRIIQTKTNKVKKIVVTTKHPKQQVQAPVVKRDALRITLRPTECRIRKKYKKKMLKSIAAQIQRSGGNVSSWRNQRAKRRNIIYRC